MKYAYSLKDRQFENIATVLKEAAEKINKGDPWQRNYENLKWESHRSHFEIFGGVLLNDSELEVIISAFLVLKNVLFIQKEKGVDYDIYIFSASSVFPIKIAECARISVLDKIASYC